MCLFEVYNTRNKVILNTEYCGTVSLRDFIMMKSEGLSEERRIEKYKEIFKELIKAINYLHLMNVSHRDLKLDNILINEDGKLKLIDFGFAVYRQDRNDLIDNFCGTPTYMAPEIIKRDPYDPHKADIWALGVLLFRMITNRYPFKGATDEELFNRILNSDFQFDKQVPDPLKKLFFRVFEVNPAKRASAMDILKSEWFNE